MSMDFETLALSPIASCQDRLTAIDDATLRKLVCRHVRQTLGKDARELTRDDVFRVVALSIRDLVVERMVETSRRYDREDPKRVYYLSMEFLMGRSLGNNLINLGIFEACREVLEELGVDLDEALEVERDAALGNGGLGRLAACFLDSLATLGLAGQGYGINYQYGLFRQEIQRGHQVEKPDAWLQNGSPWLLERPEDTCLVPVYGRVVHAQDRHGHDNPMWLDWKVIVGVPHDLPVVGYGGETVNRLRLYSARASDEFDMEIFNEGDYFEAVKQKIATETISKVLYPSDSVRTGKELRLLQEYFFVACALRDILRVFARRERSWSELPEKVAIQLNDTHPALAVVELMRILVDERAVPWDEAWNITRKVCAYTNHTLLPEALEKWSVPLFEKVLPRHLQLIYEINERFLNEVSLRWPGRIDQLRKLSLIEEGSEKQVRMAHLAIVGSHSVNGVAALHSELVKTELVPDFHALWPWKFNNKTNGVTQRRWLLKANQGLASLVNETIGTRWVTDLDELRGLERYVEDASFLERFASVKRENKIQLAAAIENLVRVRVDPDSLFDAQAKRIHEYKRQLLNVMHVIWCYLRIVEEGVVPEVPRTFLFAGKAAPGYWAAKQIIKLIHNVADVVNHDPRVGDAMRVVFLPDYRVSLAEPIFAGTDLSEQISTAGMEASGTGNMKFAINGALTIGTLDGANVEIREEVGEENIFIFGFTAEEISRRRAEGSYDPRSIYESSEMARRVMDALRSPLFCTREFGLFQWIFDRVVHQGDYYFHLADLESYVGAQARVSREYANPAGWMRKAVLNTARMGKFSSDRAIREYAREIWKARPVLPRKEARPEARHANGHGLAAT